MEGRPTTLTSQKISRLEAIGMVWDARKGGNRTLKPSKMADALTDEPFRQTITASKSGKTDNRILPADDYSSTMDQQCHGGRQIIENGLKKSDQINIKISSPQVFVSVVNRPTNQMDLDDGNTRMKDLQPAFPVDKRDQALNQSISPKFMNSYQGRTLKRLIECNEGKQTTENESKKPHEPSKTLFPHQVSPSVEFRDIKTFGHEDEINGFNDQTPDLAVDNRNKNLQHSTSPKIMISFQEPNVSRIDFYLRIISGNC
jgi:hypothetical protein